MSLKLHLDMITDSQKEVLNKLEYYGKLNLTKAEASKLIDELIIEQRLYGKQPEALYYERIKWING